MNYPYPFIKELMPFWHLGVFAFGSCIGSFLNVCIWRIPRGESIVSPPSHCPKCNHNLAWYENIPFLSWLAQGGRCKHCGAGISIRYLTVELLTGLMFTAVWLRVVLNELPLTLVPLYFVVTMLIVATVFIDAKHFIIPNEITYPAMIAGLLLALLWPQNWMSEPVDRWQALLRSLRGMAAGAGGLGVMAWIGQKAFRKDALGWGDVKYLGAVGACLGVFACFFTVLVGSLLGTIVGIGLILRRKKRMRGAIPFGPYLAIGTYLWLLYGPEIILAYLRWIQRMAGS